MTCFFHQIDSNHIQKCNGFLNTVKEVQQEGKKHCNEPQNHLPFHSEQLQWDKGIILSKTFNGSSLTQYPIRFSSKV